MKKNILLLNLLFWSFLANAQDIHFSQYVATQPYLNPALTGFFDGDYRILGNFRMQSNFANAPYKTYGGMVDVSLFKNKLEDDYLAIGGYFYQDKAGDFGLTNTNGALTVAYSLGLGYKVKHFLSAGFNFGVTGKSLTATNGIFPSGVAENITGAGKLNADIGFGLNYQIYFNKRLNVFIGQSVNHINQPTDELMNNTLNKVYMKFTTHAMAKIRAAEMINVIPMFLFSRQSNHLEFNAGVNGQFLLGNYEENKTSITAGTYGRFGSSTIDAWIFLIRAEVKRFQFGFSYDLNLNDFSAANRGSEAFELSLGYIGILNFKENNRLKCPNLKTF